MVGGYLPLFTNIEDIQMQVAIPFAVSEHFDGLTDHIHKALKNKNINSLAILKGLYSYGEFGAGGRELIEFFPKDLHDAALGIQPWATVYTGISNMLKSKLISLEALGLIQTIKVEFAGATEDKVSLTNLGQSVLLHYTAVSSVTDNQSDTEIDNKIRELADFLILPLLTATTYIRGTKRVEGSEWFAMAKLVDNVISGNSTLSPTNRARNMVAIARCMDNSGKFILSENVLHLADVIEALANTSQQTSAYD